jgi:hypothetical protein
VRTGKVAELDDLGLVILVRVHRDGILGELLPLLL